MHNFKMQRDGTHGFNCYLEHKDTPESNRLPAYVFGDCNLGLSKAIVTSHCVDWVWTTIKKGALRYHNHRSDSISIRWKLSLYSENLSTLASSSLLFIYATGVFLDGVVFFLFFLCNLNPKQKDSILFLCRRWHIKAFN